MPCKWPFKWPCKWPDIVGCAQCVPICGGQLATDALRPNLRLGSAVTIASDLGEISGASLFLTLLPLDLYSAPLPRFSLIHVSNHNTNLGAYVVVDMCVLTAASRRIVVHLLAWSDTLSIEIREEKTGSSNGTTPSRATKV
ncbi:uncharacterized protein SPSK_05660 [Sporothrix schenckii 1099-18]|uniref:Uncharacterized protein n=1 Tax=Sporothrix schenckii 1099-18 TaxID=1397361 RepID=A0A0F2LWY5_SPOSC|nr:uncharacterized protein SPSK_05660 [Sporothrix schenckii 1099-18]KJR80426.1 hypothetical protein SPSK_05660 [Sporothrix schenckii 1099-18]